MKHETIKEDLAAEAVKIVTGARRSAYGKPENNFERIARLWNAHIANTDRVMVKSTGFGDLAPLTATDVATFCRFIKEARLAETPNHRDSFVDIIGYTLCQGEIALATDESIAELGAVFDKIPPSQDQASRERDAARTLIAGLQKRTADARDRSWADAANADRREAMIEGGPAVDVTRPAYLRAKVGDTIRYRASNRKVVGLATVTKLADFEDSPYRVAADIGDRYHYWLENANVLDVVHSVDQNLSAVNRGLAAAGGASRQHRADTITEIQK